MLIEKQEIQTTLYEYTGIKNIDIQRLNVKRAELFEMWHKLSFYAKKSKSFYMVYLYYFAVNNVRAIAMLEYENDL